MELPGTTPYGYALIVAGLQTLQKSPEINAEIYEDTEELIQHLESNIDVQDEKLAGELLDNLVALSETPEVEP